MARHPARCAHCRDVESYRAARQADVMAMELETSMYPGDVAIYRASHTLITFKAWLIGKRLDRLAYFA